MNYEAFIDLIKSQLFFVSVDRYENNNRILERCVCKHPLLTPKLIVVNDQFLGFRRLNRSNKSLEQFPIFCEFEYEEYGEDGDIELFHFELFSEISLPINSKLTLLNRLCEKFESSISVHRIKKIGVDDISNFIIHSKIDEFLFDQEDEDDIALEDIQGMVYEEDFEKIAQHYISQFTHFIQCFNENIVKGNLDA